MQTFSKSPAASLLYGVDWSQRYPNDTIASASVVSGGTLKSSNLDVSGMVTVAQISGGAPSEESNVVFYINLASGQVDAYTIQLVILAS